MEYFALDVSSLQYIETALAGNVEASEFREYVMEIKPFLLDPLQCKVCVVYVFVVCSVGQSVFFLCVCV